MSDERADAANQSSEEISRRDFLRKSGGILAGLAGALGLANADGLLGSSRPRRRSGYGSSSFGPKK